MICCIVGARPNFMKMAPVMVSLREQGLPSFLIHTGQHYDQNMSKIFFEELNLPKPDIYLGVGSDTNTSQTAKVMEALEKIFKEHHFNLVIVAGDVNSTLASALASAQNQIPVAHIEAGLRSYDRTMPEETNRVLTDHVSELLFTTEESGNSNLEKEGISKEKIYYVGNCMVDSLLKFKDKALSQEPWKKFRKDPKEYSLITIHRPSNVDNLDSLQKIIGIVNKVSEKIPAIFPIHPRTKKNLDEAGLNFHSSVEICSPLSYVDFLGLMANAKLVLTDSGGIQEETTALQVPCLTLRENTERPITIDKGSNKLVGTNIEEIACCLDKIISGQWDCGQIPPLWDGSASVRIAEYIKKWVNTK